MVADNVVRYVSILMVAVTVIIEIVAFAHCLTRRAEAFPVVGKLTKAVWVLMTGGALAFTVLFGYPTIVAPGGSFGPLTSMLSVFAVAIPLVYLLDLRPALRDVTEGRGNW